MRVLTPEWINPTTTSLTSKSIEFLNQIDTLSGKGATRVKMTTVESAQVLEPDFTENVTAYRELFPIGMLPTGAASRSSVPELASRFTKFFRVFPEISWEMILTATKRYVDKYAEQNYEFMKNSSYFILKADNSSGTCYELATRCDMLSHEAAPVVQQHYTIRSV